MGQGELAPSLAGMTMWVDCMPIVSSDPVHGSYQALYDNTSGTMPASATVTSSVLHLQQGNQTLDWSFAVTPPSSGIVSAGQSASVTHQKVYASGTGTGTGAPCNYCGGSWTLEVEWQTGGLTESATLGPMNVSCVY
jgi:hypothetical protein